MWMENPDIFKPNDVAKPCLDSYQTINQYGSTKWRPSFSSVNQDTIHCVWTGVFDLNMLHVEWKICESEKKK